MYFLGLLFPHLGELLVERVDLISSDTLERVDLEGVLSSVLMIIYM